RTKGMALIGIAFGLGFVLGPGIASLFAHQSLQTVGFFAAALSFVDLVFTAFMLPEPQKRSSAGEDRYGQGAGFFWNTIVDKKLRDSLAIFFISTFAFANM